MAAPLDTYLKWSAARKALVWVVLAVVVGALYYFLPGVGLQARLTTLRGLEQEFDKLGKELRENQAIADNLPKVKEEVRLLDERLAQALEKLPNTEEIPTLLQTVSDLGKDSGLEFLLFKPGAPAPKEFYAEVPLDLQMLGHYHDLATFFDKISRLPRIVTVENIDFGGGKQGPGGVTLTASCRALTFKFMEQGSAPANSGKDKKGAKKKGGRG